MNTIKNVGTVNSKSHTHSVNPAGNGWQVVSGTSGNTYDVTPVAGGFSCTCEWGNWRSTNDTRSGCSHVQAVVAFQADGYKLKAKNAWMAPQVRKAHRRLVDIGDGVIFQARKTA